MSDATPDFAFACSSCGAVHRQLPTDLGYLRPLAYFEVPPEERDSRIELTPDTCVIDGTYFFVRGILKVPLLDSTGYLGWGIWAWISGKPFQRYVGASPNGVSRLQTARGKLSHEFPGYPSSNLHPVRVRFQASGLRPLLLMEESSHPLFHEQVHGITVQRSHEIVRVALPHLFAQSAASA